MATAITVRQFLDQRHLPYEVVAHTRTSTRLQATKAAMIAPRTWPKRCYLRKTIST